MALKVKVNVQQSSKWYFNFYQNDFRFFSRVDESLVEMISVEVIGHGVVYELCQELVDVFKPLVKFFDVDYKLCLPHPHQPDFPKYAKIGILTVCCWTLLVLEPFGLRLRSLVMQHFYPNRSLERTVWLYHHILRRRMKFSDYARRQASRKLRLNEPFIDETAGCFEIFRAKIDRWLDPSCDIMNQAKVKYFIGFGYAENYLEPATTSFACCADGQVQGRNQYQNFKWFYNSNCEFFICCSKTSLVTCSTPECTGIYCVKCFIDLKNCCVMCKNPIHYGDDSEVA